MNVTAKDMQDAMLRFLGGNNEESTVLDCRSAVIDGLNELWGRHDWPWYLGQHSLRINGPYSTGTIAYDASTRQVTLTGGTWPAWAIYGTFTAEDEYAKVTKVISSTVLELEDGTPLVDNIAAGTAYRLHCSEYPLPEGIRKISYLTNDDQINHVVKYVLPTEFSTRRPGTYGSKPLVFTIQKDRRQGKGHNIVLFPPPGSDATLRFSYVRAPRPITIWAHSTGTVSVTATDSTITGVGSLFEERHEGTLFRLGRDGSNLPTASFGLYPALQETMVDTYTSATLLEAEDAFDNTVSGRKYVISSLIDIDPLTMLSLLEKECYLKLGEKRNKSIEQMQVLGASHRAALKNAIAKAKPTQQITYAGQGINRPDTAWVTI